MLIIWLERSFKSRIQWSKQIIRRDLTRHTILWSQNKFWRHKKADRVSAQSKWKTMQFRGIFVWIIVLKHLSNQKAFHNMQLHHFFRDQLALFKATCPFNVTCLSQLDWVLPSFNLFIMSRIRGWAFQWTREEDGFGKNETTF